MQTVDPAVAGGAFQAVTPPTTVQQVPAGGVPIVDPDESQTVMQQVAPVTYQDVVPTAGSGLRAQLQQLHKQAVCLLYHLKFLTKHSTQVHKQYHKHL